MSAIGKRWRACYAFKGCNSKGGLPVKGIANVNSFASSEEDCWNPYITSDAYRASLQGIVDTIIGYVVQSSK